MNNIYLPQLHFNTHFLHRKSFYEWDCWKFKLTDVMDFHFIEMPKLIKDWQVGNLDPWIKIFMFIQTILTRTDKLRLIEFIDANGTVFTLLTNRLDLMEEELFETNKNRWYIELFFSKVVILPHSLFFVFTW